MNEQGRRAKRTSDKRDGHNAGKTQAGGRGVATSSNISGSVIITGNGNVVNQAAFAAGGASQPAGQSPTISLLVLASNPSDTARLRLDEEVRAIDHAMRQGAFREQFELRSHWAVRIEDLHELFLRYRPMIVHFCGHGGPSGEIILQDADGNAVPVPADYLHDLFRIFREDVRCVVLNACDSAPQAAAIAAHVDCGVGMAAAIADQTAIQFAVAFYRALAYGRTVQTAFELGLNQLGIRALPDGRQPRLFGRADPAQVRLVEMVDPR